MGERSCERIVAMMPGIPCGMAKYKGYNKLAKAFSNKLMDNLTHWRAGHISWDDYCLLKLQLYYEVIQSANTSEEASRFVTDKWVVHITRGLLP